MLFAVVLGFSALAACNGSTGKPSSPRTIAVSAPDSIQDAVDQAEPGDTIEISAGTYDESVTVRRRNITIRGLDRDRTIIEGGGVRSNGVVATAPGFSVENLTVRNFNLNGVLVTGMSDQDGGLARGSDGYTRLDPTEFPPLDGFAVRHVTASNNGLYGIYAFDSRNGIIEDNYASGHADSGLYVGQCESCQIVVRNNVAEFNAVGYEQTNASDAVFVVANRFTDNRVGMTLASDYQEAFVPQRGSTVIGNVISDNDQSQTPAQADGGFGIGLGIAGGQDNLVRLNRITGHPTAGIVVASSEDIPPDGNHFSGNEGSGNALDLAYTASPRAPGSGNCVEGELSATSPASIQSLWPCPHGNAKAVGTPLTSYEAPDGISFRDVGMPPPQPSMPSSGGEPEAPEVDLTTIRLPPADYLAERSRVGR